MNEQPQKPAATESTLPNTPRPRSQLVKRQKRDEQIRRLTRRMRSLAPYTDDPRYYPLLRTFAQTTILLQRTYDRLREQDIVSEQTGEVRQSVSTFRQLAETQRGLARELGLSPTVAPSLAKPVKVFDLGSMRDADEQ